MPIRLRIVALSELSSRGAVEAAMDEYDRLGRGPFLAKYKSKGPYRYYVVRRGVRYESKPITAAAHGFEFGRPLETASFSGGAATVSRKLNELGFEVGGPTGGPEEITDLEPGQSYSWSELGTIFDFKPEYLAIAGGMIARPDDGVVLLITHPGGARSFDYGDYWDGEDLIYTGRGQRGNQERVGPNRDVGENSARLLVFEAGDVSRQLEFLGSARCVDEWVATAPDREHRERQVFRFRLRFDGVRTGVKEEPRARTSAPERRPRPFDPSRSPRDAHAKGWRRSPDEILALQEKARKGHHALLVALATWLEHCGWTNVEEIEGAVDLWANRPDSRDRVIFEAKTVRRKVEVKRVRAAVAQLLEYRYFYGRPGDTLCVAVDRPLSDVRCRLLDSLGVAVLWRDGQRFCAGSRTAAELLDTSHR